MGKSGYDWAAIAAEPQYVALQRCKSQLLAGLLLAAVSGYFLLALGAALFPEGFAVRIFGPVNLAIVLVLLEFVVVLGVAAIYAWRANRDVDRLAAEIGRRVAAGNRAQP